MQVASFKRISVGLTALTLAISTSGCTIPKSLADSPSSTIGNSFSPKTAAPEEVKQGVSEADTVREAAKLKANLTTAAIGDSTPYPQEVAADGRVYNVFSTVNIRSCASTSCKVVRVAYPGADVQNDSGAGIKTSNGFTWVRVTYGYASNRPCETTAYKGWMIVNGLSPSDRTVYVNKTPLNIRSSPCSGRIIKTVPVGTQLDFHVDDNQSVGKWYKVVIPGATPGPLGYVDGWDFTDVY